MLSSASVHVLNGRGRLFETNGSALTGYRLKRFLEKSFLVETAVLVMFLLSSPFMALWDLRAKSEL